MSAQFVKYAVVASAAILGLSACGDESTVSGGGSNVSIFDEKLGECSESNQGAMAYVTDSAALYFCADGEWVPLKGQDGEDGKDGKDGENGKKGEDGKKGDKGDKGDNGDNGTSCTAEIINEGIEVSCDGEVLDTLRNGKSAFELAESELSLEDWLASLKGDKGEDGLSCSASQIENNDGTKTTTITCEIAEGESAEYVVNDGKDGTSCTAEIINEGIEVSCDGEVLDTLRNGKSAFELAESELSLEDWLASLKGDKGDKGDKGEDGLSCSASQIENNDGTKTTTITCETAEGESAEYVVNDGKDGTSCSISDKGNGVVKLICGDNSVNLKEPLCGSTPYDPEKWICFGDGELIQNTASSTATSSAAAPITSSASYSSEAAPSSSASAPSSSASVPSSSASVPSSSASVPSSSGAAPSCEETVKGSYIDTRDDHEYKTVTIGDRTWFAENIQYSASSVKTKVHTDGGQLVYYGADGVCPEGWRLPSKADFEDLIARATCGGTGDPSIVLRSTTWDGTDELGFSVVPAGNCGTSDCWNPDKYTAFWTADADPVASRTYTTLSFDYANDDPDTEKMFLGETKTDFGISIRCVKDKE